MPPSRPTTTPQVVSIIIMVLFGEEYRLSRIVAYRLYLFLVPSRVSRSRSRFWLKRDKAGVLSDPVAPFSGVDTEPFQCHGDVWWAEQLPRALAVKDGPSGGTRYIVVIHGDVLQGAIVRRRL